MNNYSPGLLEDFRPVEAKEKDYFFAEIASGEVSPLPTKEDRSKWRNHPISSQDGSSACVAFATAKARAIKEFNKTGVWVNLAERDIYNRRINFPGEGMIFQDACNIVKKTGVTLEELMPSENMGEVFMNNRSDRTIITESAALAYRWPSYVTLPLSFDGIANLLAKGEPVVLGFSFSYKEWTDIPEVLLESTTIRHAVCAVDAFVYMGVPYILIEDSWGPTFGFEGRRLISEAFFYKRCFTATHFPTLEVKPDGYKPRHLFKNPLQFIAISTVGHISNPKLNNKQHGEVVILQDVLKYEGFMPTNIPSTGYYGAITASAVLKFQQKYKVDTAATLIALKGQFVGPKTRSELNKRYS